MPCPRPCHLPAGCGLPPGQSAASADTGSGRGGGPTGLPRPRRPHPWGARPAAPAALASPGPDAQPGPRAGRGSSPQGALRPGPVSPWRSPPPSTAQSGAARSPAQADLADAAAARAHEHHSAAPVVVGGYSGQAVVLVHEQGRPLDGDRAAQRLVEVLPAEVVVDLEGLRERGRVGGEARSLGPAGRRSQHRPAPLPRLGRGLRGRSPRPAQATRGAAAWAGGGRGQGLLDPLDRWGH